MELADAKWMDLDEFLSLKHYRYLTEQLENTIRLCGKYATNPKISENPPGLEAQWVKNPHRKSAKKTQFFTLKLKQ